MTRRRGNLVHLPQPIAGPATVYLKRDRRHGICAERAELYAGVLTATYPHPRTGEALMKSWPMSEILEIRWQHAIREAA